MPTHTSHPAQIFSEYDVPDHDQRYSGVILPLKVGAEQRNIKRCDACGGAGQHAHFLPKGCSVCRGTGVELWELPPLRPEASRFVVFSWIGLFLVGALFWAGIGWAVVAWRNAL